MGFLELMSTRREAALKRKAEKMNRIKKAGMSEHKHLEDVVKGKRQRYKEKESDLRKWARKLGYGIDEVKKLKERFDEQDEDKSGEIDLEELRDMLSTMAVENKEKRYREYVNLSRDEAKLSLWTTTTEMVLPPWDSQNSWICYRLGGRKRIMPSLKKNHLYFTNAKLERL